MAYNYNRLWKLLIDKGMTKTQMRLQAGIRTNIPALKWARTNLLQWKALQGLQPPQEQHIT